MKALIFISGLLISGAAFAQDFLPTGYGAGMTCTATDSGWEEHWGGHPNCAACQRQHEDCVESCRAREYQCEAVGVVFDRRSGRWVQERFYGRGQDQWSAEDDAAWECRRYRARNCQVTGCNVSEREVSRRSCR